MALSIWSPKRLLRPSAKPPHASHLHAVGSHQLLICLALEERVRLDLVDRRGHPVVFDEVDEPIGVEVGDTDCPASPSSCSCSTARQKL
jgi:hypothetical protein